MATIPVLIYDGDCSFCEYWVSRWQRRNPLVQLQQLMFQKWPLWIKERGQQPKTPIFVEISHIALPGRPFL